MSKTPATKTKTAPEPATVPAQKPGFRVPPDVERAVNANRPAFAPRQRMKPSDDAPPQIPHGDYPALCKMRDQFRWWLNNFNRLGHLYDPTWFAFFRDLRIACAKAEEGMPLTHADPQQVARERGEVICTGEWNRKTQSDDLQAALDSNFDGIPISPLVPIAEPLVSYLLTDGRERATALSKALARLQIARNEAFPLIYPRSRAEERKLALHSNPTPEQSRRIAEEAALESNPHFQQLSANARNRLWEQHRTEIKPLEVAIIEGAITFVNGCKEAAIAAEQALFFEAELPHEPTAVSKRFDAILERLKHEHKLLVVGSGIAVAGVSPAAPDATRSVLTSVFGVELL
jgi:hypothetical protein